jgi:hypothetical protein
MNTLDEEIDEMQATIEGKCVECKIRMAGQYDDYPDCCSVCRAQIILGDYCRTDVELQDKFLLDRTYEDREDLFDHGPKELRDIIYDCTERWAMDAAREARKRG